MRRQKRLRSSSLCWRRHRPVYGRTEALPFTESDTADRPLAAYPASKRAAEILAHTYHNLFGMQVTALRFFNVYGPAGRAGYDALALDGGDADRRANQALQRRRYPPRLDLYRRYRRRCAGGARPAAGLRGHQFGLRRADLAEGFCGTHRRHTPGKQSTRYRWRHP